MLINWGFAMDMINCDPQLFELLAEFRKMETRDKDKIMLFSKNLLLKTLQDEIEQTQEFPESRSRREECI